MASLGRASHPASAWISRLIFISLGILMMWSPVKAENPVWYSGERLDFEIGWGFVTAGDAVLLTRGTWDDGRLEFMTYAHNNGFFETIYPVRDTIRTVARKRDLIPEYFRKVNHEGSWHNRSQIHFDWNKKVAKLADTVFTSLNGPVKRHTDTLVELNGDYHCIISAFYKARTLPLEVGKEWVLMAVSGKKKYRMRVRCLRKETVEVLAGRFSCFVVEPVLDDDGLFQAKGKLTIWLSDDNRRLPVLMKSKIAVGSIRAELKSWSQGPSSPR